MPDALIIGGIMAATTAFSTGMKVSASGRQAKQAKKMAAYDKEQRRIEMKRNQLQIQKDKIRVARESRIRRGALISGGSLAMGAPPTAGTSSLAAGQYSIRSQEGQNIGQLGSFAGFSQRASELSQASAESLSKFHRIGAKTTTLTSIFDGVGSLTKAHGADVLNWARS